jgi:hypothetical protein
MLTRGVGAPLAGGWQVSGILQLQTGFPYTIDYKGDPINVGGGSGGGGASAGLNFDGDRPA